MLAKNHKNVARVTHTHTHTHTQVVSRNTLDRDFCANKKANNIKENMKLVIC